MSSWSCTFYILSLILHATSCCTISKTATKQHLIPWMRHYAHSDSHKAEQCICWGVLSSISPLQTPALQSILYVYVCIYIYSWISAAYASSAEMPTSSGQLLDIQCSWVCLLSRGSCASSSSASSLEVPRSSSTYTEQLGICCICYLLSGAPPSTALGHMTPPLHTATDRAAG